MKQYGFFYGMVFYSISMLVKRQPSKKNYLKSIANSGHKLNVVVSKMWKHMAFQLSQKISWVQGL